MDALELEAEDEGPSYLADLNKAPDFIDEPPVELPEVCRLYGTRFVHMSLRLATGASQGASGGHQDKCLSVRIGATRLITLVRAMCVHYCSNSTGHILKIQAQE